jgi:hypothetical protein
VIQVCFVRCQEFYHLSPVNLRISKLRYVSIFTSLPMIFIPEYYRHPISDPAKFYDVTTYRTYFMRYVVWCLDVFGFKTSIRLESAYYDAYLPLYYSECISSSTCMYLSLVSSFIKIWQLHHKLWVVVSSDHWWNYGSFTFDCFNLSVPVALRSLIVIVSLLPHSTQLQRCMTRTYVRLYWVFELDLLLYVLRTAVRLVTA